MSNILFEWLNEKNEVVFILAGFTLYLYLVLSNNWFNDKRKKLLPFIIQKNLIHILNLFY